VRAFLGTAGYYRRIAAFGELTSPLTDLTRKGASDPVQWTEQCQVAFEEVKKALCGEPLLFTPNFELPFVLQTDAPNRGLRPRRSTVLRYSTVEKKCLAKWPVDTLRYYLLGRSLHALFGPRPSPVATPDDRPGAQMAVADFLGLKQLWGMSIINGLVFIDAFLLSPK